MVKLLMHSYTILFNAVIYTLQTLLQILKIKLAQLVSHPELAFHGQTQILGNRTGSH